MPLGLQGAYGAEAISDALRQRIKDQLAQRQAEQEMALNLRSADRADRSLNQQDELKRLTLDATAQDRKDRLAETARNNQVDNARAQFPFLKEDQNITAPDAENMRVAGLGSFLKGTVAQPEQLASKSFASAGAMPEVGATGAVKPGTVLAGSLRMMQEPAAAAKDAGFQFTGTAADERARDATQIRSEDLAANRTATTERADADRAMRGEIAKLAASTKVATAGATAGATSGDASAIADAIISGKQPPTLTGLYRFAAPIRAELAKKGYDLTSATTDWQATTKHLATLNGPQQTRMRQAVDNAYHSLDVIEDLAGQWKGGKFPLLNKANLIAAKGGAYGPEAQQTATNLEAQIADVTSELGNVYMGGNSPTDHALGLAKKNLSADWTEAQLRSAIALSRRNLQIRQNSMNNVGPAGTGETNQYATDQAPKAKSGVTIKSIKQIN